MSKFPSKDDIITSLKKGPCQGVFEKYYSESTFKKISKFENFVFDMGEVFGKMFHKPIYSENAYINLDSFLRDHDGLIYFFYSLSQIEDSRKWQFATDILDSFRCKAVIQDPYGVHEYFRGMSEVLNLKNGLPENHIKGLIQGFKTLASDLRKSIVSLSELTNAFKDMLKIYESGNFGNLVMFLQDYNLKRVLNTKLGSRCCRFESFVSIFYLTLKETPILEKNQNIFATWVKIMEKADPESSMIMKSFITHNKHSLFDYCSLLVPQEVLKLLAICKIDDKEIYAEVADLFQVLSGKFHGLSEHESVLGCLAEIPNRKCVKIFCDLAIQHQEVIKGFDDFDTLLRIVSNENTDNLAQSLVAAHDFQDFIKSYSLGTFLQCHSSKVDFVHWETAIELTDNDAFGKYGVYDFSDALKCLSLIKNPDHWEKASQLAEAHADILDEDSRNADDLEAFFSFLSNHPFENWDEAVKNKYWGSSSEQDRDG